MFTQKMLKRLLKRLNKKLEGVDSEGFFTTFGMERIGYDAQAKLIRKMLRTYAK